MSEIVEDALAEALLAMGSTCGLTATEDARQILDALLAVGLIVVPAAATEEMSKQGRDELGKAGFDSAGQTWQASQCYGAMINAALAEQQTVRPSTGKAEPPPGWSAEGEG